MPTAPQPTLALSRLFGSDLDPLRRAWGREALLASLDERDAGDAFADLFSPEAVDELIADDALLSRIMSECRNNPGDLSETANCRNAEVAVGKLRLENMRRALGG